MRPHELACLFGLSMGACSFRSLEPLLCPPDEPTCEGTPTPRMDAEPGDGAMEEKPHDASTRDAAQVSDDAAGCEGSCEASVELLYASSSGDERIRFSFALRNLAHDPVVLFELTVRYYFTTETGGEQVYECSSVIDGDFGCTDVLWSAAESQAERTNRYVEFGFSEQAGELAGDGMRTGEIKGLIRNADFSDFDQSNDYSYSDAHSDLGPHDRMTVYRAGTLIWGIEPR